MRLTLVEAVCYVYEIQLIDCYLALNFELSHVRKQILLCRHENIELFGYANVDIASSGLWSLTYEKYSYGLEHIRETMESRHSASQ